MLGLVILPGRAVDISAGRARPFAVSVILRWGEDAASAHVYGYTYTPIHHEQTARLMCPRNEY
jgi:hypothetical protein